MKHRQYGPSHKRGLSKFALKRCKDRKPIQTYTVPPGTWCEYRVGANRAWSMRKTVRELKMKGCLWKNESHIGFMLVDAPVLYEVKFKLADVIIA